MDNGVFNILVSLNQKCTINHGIISNKITLDEHLV